MFVGRSSAIASTEGANRARENRICCLDKRPDSARATWRKSLASVDDGRGRLGLVSEIFEMKSTGRK